MRTTINIAVAVLILFALAVIPSVGETLNDSPDLVSLYAKGKREMREGDFLDASRTFEEAAGRFPDSPNLDLIIFNKAKADYYAADYDKAIAGFANFAARYPHSPLTAFAMFFQSNALYIKGNVTQAVRGYIDAYGASNSKDLDNLIVGSLQAAIADANAVTLGTADFERLHGKRKCSLIHPVVEALTKRGLYEMANRLLAPCGEGIEIPSAAYTGELRVAVVLPLSGELQTFGEDIYNGVVIAAEQYRKETGNKLSLQPFDTKGDPVNAARIVSELSNSSFDVAIGPLTSDEAEVASAAVGCGDLPLVAPAATQAGLTMLSQSAFQLSPNIELQGAEMAEYAARTLKADSAAIITSAGTDDVRMADAFAERFKQLGGRVIATEYYRSRDRDFGDYIRDIKAILLGLHQDSTFFINDQGDTLDADGLPAYIDCLFLPGQPAMLKQLLPQINFYNLNASYLGSDGWGDEDVYKLGDHITKSGVFPSPYLQKNNSDAYLQFATQYDTRYGEQPRRLAALGYDALNLVAAAVKRGGTTRETLIDELLKTDNYQGAAGVVSFGQYRENVAMPVYRIEGQQPVYLGVGEIGTPQEMETETAPDQNQ